MKLPDLPFTVTDWAAEPATEYPGESGTAHWHTKDIGDVRIRLVECSAGYISDHWCDRGHILFVVEGEVTTDLQDGRSFHLSKGMGFQVSDYGDSPHRTRTSTGAKIFIVD